MNNQFYARINRIVRHLDNARDSAVADNLYDVDGNLQTASAALTLLLVDVEREIGDDEGDDNVDPFPADVNAALVRDVARLTGYRDRIDVDAEVRFASDGATVWANNGDAVFVDGDDLERVREDGSLAALSAEPNGCPTGPTTERRRDRRRLNDSESYKNCRRVRRRRSSDRPVY